MNIKDIFGKAENGTLTFEQFEELAKADGAKFTDLSEGNYVSKQKFDSEMAAKDSAISQLNDNITQRDTDLSALRTQLESAGTDATKLSDLQGKFDTLQSQYDKDMKEYQTKLTQQAYEFASREFANSQKFTSNAAKRDFTAKMIEANLTYDATKKRILGADDFVTSYKEDNPDAFVTEEPTTPAPTTPAQPKPQFAAPLSGTGTQTKESDKSMFGFNFSTVRKKD